MSVEVRLWLPEAMADHLARQADMAGVTVSEWVANAIRRDRVRAEAHDMTWPRPLPEEMTPAQRAALAPGRCDGSG